MRNVVAFGEILLRLSPPGRERLFQSPSLQTYFGGAEANVAASLAQFGHSVRMISFVPGNEIGSAAVRALRQLGVETDHILRKGHRLGIYIVETGANQKPTQVIYDRAHSATAEAKPGDIDWAKALTGRDWLHVSGITPAISRGAADLALEAVTAARTMGVTVSVDLNYRAKLWNYGCSAPAVMTEIFKFADLGFANEEDCQKALGMDFPVSTPDGKPDLSAFERLAQEVMSRFPSLKRLAVTMRDSRSADHNVWSAILRNREECLRGSSTEITHIVDRIGGGDAFAAGLIHGLDVLSSDREALEFALAASCLKHSIPGDFNLVSEREVLALMRGDRSGRVRR